MTDYINEFCMHDATCGELRKSDVGREVTLCGWAWHNRDHGGLIFCDLRDRTGYTQVVVDPDCVPEEDFHKAEHLGREYALQITGTVRDRGADAVNPNMATGEIEVLASKVNVLNESVTPPFSIEDGIETDETTRMKWRYMDLRRPEMYQSLRLRHTVAQAMRAALNERGFIEVETPILAQLHARGRARLSGALPSEPGQVLRAAAVPAAVTSRCSWLAGFDRYYQIARCFRDEDLRADRQPEFTQVDIEMSFVAGDDVMDRRWRACIKEVSGSRGREHDVPAAAHDRIKRPWTASAATSPDVRFGMELVDLTDIVRGCGFGVFSKAVEAAAAS